MDTAERDLILLELDIILGSDQFKNSPRLSTFLRYVVLETIAGNASQLKAYSIAVEAFGRDADFDTQNPYIRNVAKDVRKALIVYYESAQQQSIRIKIDIPKGKYVPRFNSVAQPVRSASVVSSDAESETGQFTDYGSDKPTIAVIPLVPLRCDETQRYIGEIFADDLINKISRHDSFNVISRLSTSSFSDITDMHSAIRNQLKANYVVSGTFSISAKRAKLSVELSGTATGFVLFSEQIHTSIGNLLKLSDDIIIKVIASINGSITKNEIERSLTHNPLQLENYTLLISSVNLLHRIGKSDFYTAKEQLDILVDRNTGSPLPHAWAAKWHVLSHVQGLAENHKTLQTTASDCTKKALDLDSDCSLALTIDGLVHTNILRKLDVAEDRYNAALQTNPSDSLARLLRGTLHAFKGEGDKAMSDVVKALTLSPCDPKKYYYLSLSSTAALAARDYDTALSYADVSLKLNPNHASTLRAAAIANVNLDNTDAAKQNVEMLLRLDPEFSVDRFLAESPSAEFETGKHWAKSLQIAGVP